MAEPGIEQLREVPGAEEYVELRRLLGWGEITLAAAKQTLEAATFTVCLRDASKLVGLVRVVGDGVLYIFVADLMVHPDYAGRGLGNVLMQSVMGYINEVADPAATVTLVALPGREGFYERFGYERCPNSVFGQGMAYLGHMKR